MGSSKSPVFREGSSQPPKKSECWMLVDVGVFGNNFPWLYLLLQSMKEHIFFIFSLFKNNNIDAKQKKKI